MPISVRMLRGSPLVRRSFRASAAVGAFLQTPAPVCPRRGRSTVGVAAAHSPRRSRPGVVFSTSSSSPASSSSSPASLSELSGDDPSWLRRDLAIVLVHPQVNKGGSEEGEGREERHLLSLPLPLLLTPLSSLLFSSKKIMMIRSRKTQAPRPAPPQPPASPCTSSGPSASTWKTRS